MRQSQRQYISHIPIHELQIASPPLDLDSVCDQYRQHRRQRQSKESYWCPIIYHTAEMGVGVERVDRVGFGETESVNYVEALDRDSEMGLDIHSRLVLLDSNAGSRIRVVSESGFESTISSRPDSSFQNSPKRPGAYKFFNSRIPSPESPGDSEPRSEPLNSVSEESANGSSNESSTDARSRRIEKIKVQVVSASFGSLLTSLSMTPFDVIKTRMQANTTTTKSLLRSLIYDEGLKSLWKGLVPTLIMTVPQTALYFVLYEGLKDIGNMPTFTSPGYDTIHTNTIPNNIYAPAVYGSIARSELTK